MDDLRKQQIMARDDDIRQMLRACLILVMAKATDVAIDLTRLRSEHVEWWINQEARALSNGLLTVRPADSQLFVHNGVQGPYYYMALCPAETPGKIIRELTDDTTLFGLGPYQTGFTGVAEVANTDLQSRRAFQKLIEDSRMGYRQYSHFRTLIWRHGEVATDSIRNQVRSFLGAKDYLDVESVAELYAILGFTLDQVKADIARIR